MPKKKSDVYNRSQICGMGTDPVWDDTELVHQFDRALREWKEERKYLDSGSDSEEVPQIGPWVSVEFDPEQMALQTQMTPIPFLDDYEMISLYDEALTSWKTERKLKKKLGEISVYSSEDTPTKVVCSPNEHTAHYGPWMSNEPPAADKVATEEQIKSSVSDDFEMIKLYDSALTSWKESDDKKHEETQKQQTENHENQDHENTPNGKLNSETLEKSFKKLDIKSTENGHSKSEESSMLNNGGLKKDLSKCSNEISEIVEPSVN